MRLVAELRRDSAEGAGPVTSAIVWLLIVLSPSCDDSLRYAATFVGTTRQERRELYRELRQISVRESSLCGGRGRGIRGHEDDRANTRHTWAKAIRAGWVDRDIPRDVDAVHGQLGLTVPYNLRWLGIRWAPAWIFDVPLVSAFAGARKHKAKCWRTFEADGKRVRGQSKGR